MSCCSPLGGGPAPTAALPDGGQLFLTGGGEPSQITFTTPNTYKIGTSGVGLQIGADGAHWALPDGSIATVVYSGETRLYRFEAFVALEAAATGAAELTSAGIDLNGDLLALLVADADSINRGGLPMFVPDNGPMWVHAVRMIQVADGDEISLALATADGTTRTSQGACMTWIQLNNFIT